MNKILCLIDTLGYGGGAERQMAGLAGFLHQKGYDVDLATYHKHDMNPYLKRAYGIESKILDCGNGQLSKFRSVRRFIKDGGYNTVIAYKNGATKIACLCKLTGLNFHLLVSERNTNITLNRALKLKFLLYRVADFIVPNSYAQGDFICSQFPKLASKVRVITNFTDTNHFVPKKSESEEERLNILTTARIAPQKNLIAFMNVIRRLKDNNILVHFDWYGGVYVGKEDYSRMVEKEYERLDIADFLTFHKPTREIINVYQSCDVFCLPSLYEGYPNVICEAMSCGKPIICSRICDNPLIVEEGKNGLLFDPTDENSIYDVIVNLCSLSRSVINEMGTVSRELAKKKFSEEAFINKYIEIL